MTAAPPALRLGIRPAAAVAWRVLQDALKRSVTVPCAGRDEWCSDDTNARLWAAQQCLQCPVLAVCHRFAEANGETANVWGGIDRSVRRSRTAQRKGMTR